jgi:TolA-binding protein
LTACPLPKKDPPRAAAARSAPVLVDAAAQQKAYQMGVSLYGEEKYAEAKTAWQEAVRLGPDTDLGRKSQADLQKVSSMLETLKELDKK